MIYLIIIQIFAQIINTTPFPTLATPTPFTGWDTATPYSTPTPAPTHTPFLVGTAFITATPNANVLPTSVVISNNQIFFHGRPTLPNEDGGLLFRYMKWFFGSGSSSAFGPFAPLIVHVSIIITIFFMLFAIWIVQQVFRVAVSFFLWVIRFVRGGG